MPHKCGSDDAQGALGNAPALASYRRDPAPADRSPTRLLALDRRSDVGEVRPGVAWDPWRPV